MSEAAHESRDAPISDAHLAAPESGADARLAAPASDDSAPESGDDDSPTPPASRAGRSTKPGREDRKAAKAAAKAATRAKRDAGGIALKRCDLCGHERALLYRCTVDASQAWRFVCAGACWDSVSGGVADGAPSHPHYRYGGTWKLFKR